MKKQIVALALIGISNFAFAQKKEVKALEKAVKTENFMATPELIEAAENVIEAADDKLKQKFYYLKAKAILSGIDFSLVESALVGFEANKAAKYEKEITELKTTCVTNIVNAAIQDSKTSNHVASAEKLMLAYNLSEDTEYLYYASSSYVKAKKYKLALPLLLELKDLGYTGVKTTYLATNVETQKDDTFSSEETRAFSIKMKSHINPTEKVSKSVRPEIVKNIGYIYVDLGEVEKAFAAVKEARADSPNDIQLMLSEANLCLKLDDKTGFKKVMEEAIEQDPTNPELFFSLGAISAEQGDDEAAKGYYKICLEIDPTYINACFNMAALLLEEESTIVKKMNSLGTSASDNRKYDALQAKRDAVYKAAVPYLETVLSVEPRNESAIQTLKNMYGVLGETAKYKEMKALLESL